VKAKPSKAPSPMANYATELDELCECIKRNEQETVRVNFALGDMLNNLVDTSGLTARKASLLLEKASGIHHSLFDNYGRIARRLSPLQRPADVPWGVIKYLFVDCNPRSFGVTENVFKKAAIRALKEVERKNLKLTDLKFSEDGWTTTAQRIIHSYIKK
jgi:hypothetical protein